MTGTGKVKVWKDSVLQSYTNAWGNVTTLRQRKCNETGCKRICQVEKCTDHLDQVLGLQIRTSTISGAGFGLFATRDFAKKTTIAKFRGKAVKSAPITKKEYVVWRGKGKYYDCSVERCSAAYANTRKSKNNSELVVSKCKCFLTSTKAIKAGQEIFVPYGQSYTF